MINHAFYLISFDIPLNESSSI